MNRLRSVFTGVNIRTRPVISKIQTPVNVQKFGSHDGPPQPFDNLPFAVPNRYVATAVFCVFFGSGFFAPFFILWYSMAKKTM